MTTAAASSTSATSASKTGRWSSSQALFGDVVVLGFLIVQSLDGAFTYLGVCRWGPGIEANPLVSAVVAAAGLGAGLVLFKLAAIGLGILLHLRQVHSVVALLTALYFWAAIVPWAALFLSHS
jgi:hypothetical protein